MVLYQSKDDFLKKVKGVLDVKEDVKVLDESSLKKMIDEIVYNMLFNSEKGLRSFLQWVVWEIAQNMGIYPSSIQGLYEARGKGLFKGFTVPAINLRTLTFGLACRIFKVARSINAGAFIFEIAKSEIGYTDQRPQEYTSSVLAAAIKEGFRGPVFIQGDHFQVKAKNFFSGSRDKEIQGLKDLIKEALKGGFFNIDIDSSTLVELDKPTLEEQQKFNYQVCAEFTRLIRQLQPKGIDVSVGGEIGEVGGKNSTPEDLHAFMQGYIKETGNLKGISKISIQTGTSHGGVVLPDGSIAKVSIDFDTLKNLSELSRKEYGLSGCVQHGASTLPKEAFHNFPEIECAEIHLATQFQNIVYDSLPQGLREEIYGWLKENCKDEWKSGTTEEQFLYKTRKKALGPFKKKICDMSADVLNKTLDEEEELFAFLFKKLKIENTKEYVAKHIKVVPVKKTYEEFAAEKKDLGDLDGAD